MCSPALLRRGPLDAPQDLTHHTVLYSELEVRHWHAWLEEVGVTGIDPQRGLKFESSTLTYQAARDGAGVVLGQPLLLARDLAEGRLVAPFDLTVHGVEAVCLACPRRRMAEPPIAAFRHWLIAEVRTEEARVAALTSTARQPVAVAG
jgi:LysR family transcriptional regulator, glycine cleavage system transcriptional activator